MLSDFEDIGCLTSSTASNQTASSQIAWIFELGLDSVYSGLDRFDFGAHLGQVWIFSRGSDVDVVLQVHYHVFEFLDAST